MPNAEHPPELTKLTLLVILCLASTAAAGANPSGKTEPAVSGWQNSTTAPKASKTLSAQDLQFGEQQLQKMRQDRPQLAKILFKNGPIWPWAVRQFAGEAANQRIYWNSNELSDKGFEYDSDHSYPTTARLGCIRLRKKDEHGKELAPDRLLAAFVFECHNISNGPAFDRVYETSLTGKLSKNQFIEQNTKIEFEATRKTADFYRRVYLPLAQKEHYATNPLYWEAESPTTYAAWIGQYKDPQKYPWSYWGKYYDESIVPYLKSVKNYDASKASGKAKP